MLFHGAVVELWGKASVFSGKQGIGKSTRADLWQKFNGAKILNGDRGVKKIFEHIKQNSTAFSVFADCGKKEIACLNIDIIKNYKKKWR